MTTISDSRRPVLSVTADLATALGTVGTNQHAYRRSDYVGEADGANGTRSQVTLEDCEAVPELGIVTLAARDEAPVGLTTAVCSFGNATHWRNVRSEVTRGAYWLQYAYTVADAAAEYAYPPATYYLHPGVRIRCRSYAVPRGQTAPSYLQWRFTEPASGVELFRLMWLRAWPGTGTDREGWYALKGGDTLSVCSDGGAWTPGADFALRVRVVRSHLIVYGLGSPWVTKLPGGVDYDAAARCTLYIRGGMAVWHVGQMVYATSGTVYGVAVPPPPHVNIGATPGDEWSGADPPGTAVAVDSDVANGALSATLTGTTLRSPEVDCLTLWLPATQAGAAVSPKTVANVLRCAVTLTREGRGQEAVVEAYDPDGTEAAKLLANGVASLNFAWDDGSPADLLAGRLVSPQRRIKRDQRLDPVLRFTIRDELYLLEATPMAFMTGTWAGRPVSDSIRDLLNAAGFADTRLTITTDTADLDGPPHAYEFAANATVADALTVLCDARGWAWRFERDGSVLVGDPALWGNDRGTLADSNATLLTYPFEVEAEVSAAEGYANSIIIQSRRGDGDQTTVYAPGIGSDGVWLWDLREGEFAEPVAAARDRYDEVAHRRTRVAWAQWLDPDNLVEPWDTFTAGTLAGLPGVTSGDLLRVVQVTYLVDGEAAAPEDVGRVEIIAEVESAS